MKKILLIHQGAELYGSDRSLLNVIDAIKGKYDIEVWLPYKGELYKEIEKKGVSIRVKELSILRFIDIIKGDFSIFKNFISNWRSYKSEAEKYDLIFFNTVVCIDFLVPLKIPKVVYVREIKNSLISFIFSVLFFLSNAYLYFNSKATASHYLYKQNNGKIVTNGISDKAPNDLSPSIDKSDPSILFIGRIIKWKGLHHLVEALKLLRDKHSDLKFSLNVVGDIYEGYDDYLLSIKEAIQEAGLEENVTFKGFVEFPEKEYLNSDFVIVPSEQPEPFGRVAVEAMMFKRIVFVADHGGLSEIVDDDINGFKFKPNSAKAIANRLEDVLLGSYNLTEIADNARKKYLDHYHSEIYESVIRSSFKSILNNNQH